MVHGLCQRTGHRVPITAYLRGDRCLRQAALPQVVHDRMGPAPSSPVIDPANFVTTIDCPYFPSRVFSPGVPRVCPHASAGRALGVGYAQRTPLKGLRFEALGAAPARVLSGPDDEHLPGYPRSPQLANCLDGRFVRLVYVEAPEKDAGCLPA
jgi:hypothetical protein